MLSSIVLLVALGVPPQDNLPPLPNRAAPIVKSECGCVDYCKCKPGQTCGSPLCPLSQKTAATTKEVVKEVPKTKAGNIGCCCGDTCACANCPMRKQAPPGLAPPPVKKVEAPKLPPIPNPIAGATYQWTGSQWQMIAMPNSRRTTVFAPAAQWPSELFAPNCPNGRCPNPR